MKLHCPASSGHRSKRHSPHDFLSRSNDGDPTETEAQGRNRDIGIVMLELLNSRVNVEITVAARAHIIGDSSSWHWM
jgi:hypothetical protein